MAAAEFSLGILFVAGALPGLFYFHFMVGKLRNRLSAGSGDFASGQKKYPRSSGNSRRIRPYAVIVTETTALSPLLICSIQYI